jgi:hypothetical protein
MISVSIKSLTMENKKELIAASDNLAIVREIVIEREIT